jgi:hypothetical protein
VLIVPEGLAHGLQRVPAGVVFTKVMVVAPVTDHDNAAEVPLATLVGAAEKLVITGGVTEAKFCSTVLPLAVAEPLIVVCAAAVPARRINTTRTLYTQTPMG